MNYRRQIVGPAYRATAIITRRREFRFSTTERADIRYERGWRLSCGHAIYGASGYKKESKLCWFCEWAEGDDAEFIQAAAQNKKDWSDTPPPCVEELVRDGFAGVQP